MAILNLFSVPGAFSGQTFEIWTTRPHGMAWAEIRDWAAWQFDCDENDVDLIEAYFGGECGDDDNRECLTVRGDIVGVFDDPLTPAEWAEMLTAIGQPSLIAEVRAAARERALVSVQ